MGFTAGSRLGPYEINGLIGAGGMGEVFRAHDTRLGRDVAIKVLPAALAQDSERVGRFRREAQILATLNHPNIAAIYGLEETSGTVGLVMELVAGDDLSQRLRAGAIPVHEAIAMARQIAEALEEAHEHGIVHRDLKPANVKVTPDGKVKVLDFGLAKALEDGSGGGSNPQLSHSPTMSRHATEAGLILGTAAYMSPEQARGKAVDKRADIWSFGVVLFEMLTGQRLFAGETLSDTLAAVLKEEVPWTTLPPGGAPGGDPAPETLPRPRSATKAARHRRGPHGSVGAARSIGPIPIIVGRAQRGGCATPHPSGRPGRPRSRFRRHRRMAVGGPPPPPGRGLAGDAIHDPDGTGAGPRRQRRTRDNSRRTHDCLRGAGRLGGVAPAPAEPRSLRAGRRSRERNRAAAVLLPHRRPGGFLREGETHDRARFGRRPHCNRRRVLSNVRRKLGRGRLDRVRAHADVGAAEDFLVGRQTSAPDRT
ncbi:MAG: serine/threonine protein kinase [Vicinamibacteria bacterium]|nr:serine/threonine protein kinase [Vicinamibacteria bacterium]